MQTLSEVQRDGVLGGALTALPLPVVVQDWSGVAEFCAEKQAAGVSDLLSVLAAPGVLGDLLARVQILEANQAASDVCGADHASDLLGPFPQKMMALTSPESFVQQVAAVFEGRSQLVTDIESMDGSGRPLSFTLNWAPRLDASGPDYSHSVAVFSENASTVEGASDGFSEQLQALIDIGSQLTAMLDPEVIFENVIHTIEDVVTPTSVSLYLLDFEAESLVAKMGECPIHGPEDPGFHVIMEGLAGAAVRSGVALISDDISSEAGFGQAAKAIAADFPGWSQIAAPIVSGDQPIGVVEALFSPDRATPTPEAASFLATLAGQVAVAVRNAEMYTELADSHEALQGAHKQLQDTQTQLLSAQKMEAIGSLAAGIAHEINTPIQYVSDNVTFLKDTSESMADLLATIGSIMRDVAAAGNDEAMAKYTAALDAADMEFIQGEVPDAFAQTLEGVERVAQIVRAMKEFAHPGNDEKAPIDINRSIETTVEVAKNEWKYVAELDLQLDPELPHVPALTGPLNQVILILVVNAAQALADEIEHGRMDKGEITVATSLDEGHAVIRVTDNGPGIPESIADQIFDPFFTTKDVGKGSGQGLSIAHSVIVERHGGTIHVESTYGDGASFVIRLPL